MACYATISLAKRALLGDTKALGELVDEYYLRGWNCANESWEHGFGGRIIPDWGVALGLNLAAAGALSFVEHRVDAQYVADPATYNDKALDFEINRALRGLQGNLAELLWQRLNGPERAGKFSQAVKANNADARWLERLVREADRRRRGE